MAAAAGRLPPNRSIGPLARVSVLLAAVAAAPAQAETPKLKFTIAGKDGTPVCVIVPGRLHETPRKITRATRDVLLRSRPTVEDGPGRRRDHRTMTRFLVNGWADYRASTIVLVTVERATRTDRRAYMVDHAPGKGPGLDMGLAMGRARVLSGDPSGDATVDAIAEGWRVGKVEMIPTDLVLPQHEGCG